MKILTVDIGTGTQDIFLYDSQLNIENGFKLVVPSPTMIVNRRIKEATRRELPILLHGVIMGGGPSQWAAEDH
ncbi:MAG: pyruvate formate lyase-activating protein, partial [Chloroflexi bacterium]